MSHTARILRSILMVAMAGALLGSSLPCDSVCAAMSSVQADDASSHCAKHEPPPPADTPTDTPTDTPCDDECAGCADSRVSIPSSSASASAATVDGHLAVASNAPAPTLRNACSAALNARALEAPPPRDVLSLTTILLI